MKKIIFALPLVALFTYCSSSRKATTPPAGPGISNVNVITGGDTVSGSAIQVTPENRDWAYSATRDTLLKGNWTLHAMATETGELSITNDWYRDTTLLTNVNAENPAAQDSLQSFHSGSETITTKSTKKKNSKSSLQATSSLAKYDSLMANRVVYDDSSLNAGLKPYEYWKRIPTLSINPTSLVFTGNTGCNTMSGSFNFSGDNIKFNRNIATSKMACHDYNEGAFLEMLRKADNYTINNEGLLELKQGDQVLLVFSRQV